MAILESAEFTDAVVFNVEFSEAHAVLEAVHFAEEIVEQIDLREILQSLERITNAGKEIVL